MEEEEGTAPDVVPRSADVLVAQIKQFIVAGSVVYSDMWKGYVSLGKIGHTYHQVNHSKEFVLTSDTTIHTQNIKWIWRDIKEWIKKPELVLYHIKKVHCQIATSFAKP